MTESAALPPINLVEPDSDVPETATVQTGSPLFAELVWAHHLYERSRKKSHDPGQVDELKRAYEEKLKDFQERVGELEHVYWSTKGASAVGMTVKHTPPKRRLLPRLVEHDEHIRLHRLSDWVTAETAQVADLLHECDLLAIRVGEVLRGTPERIAMRWLLGVQEHLLGFIERTRSPRDEKAETSIVKLQHDQLVAIERYYHRAACKTGRLVYVTGMLLGILPVLLLGALIGFLLWVAGVWGEEAELVVLCLGAGTLGALVSAISRMGKSEKGKFNIDFELGRPILRRLGFFKPLLGAIVGVALLFLLASGIAEVTVSGDRKLYYYGFAAFLAGFSERFVNVMFGEAERRLGGEKASEHDEEEQT
jgi:hypothetical protein